MLSGIMSALCRHHKAARVTARETAATVGNIMQLHGFCAANNIPDFFLVPRFICQKNRFRDVFWSGSNLGHSVFFSWPLVSAEKFGGLCRHPRFLGKQLDPFAKNRKRAPKISCSPTPCQAVYRETISPVSPRIGY